MPIGTFKNRLYGAALPLMGKRCQWKQAQGGTSEQNRAVGRLLHKRHAVGACVQRFEKGRLTECFTMGYGALEPEQTPVSEQTIFRTASIAKLVNALLVFRLETLGKLDTCEEVSDFLGYKVRNPYCPDAPLTLGMLLNHTSSIKDSPAYFASFAQPGGLQGLLEDSQAYTQAIPGMQFKYSNFGAGIIGCMLEKRFQMSYEALMQQELFEPLHVKATFDLSTLTDQPLADDYRVLPARRCFDAKARIQRAKPLNEPDPDSHYLLASGNLYLTASALAQLALVAWNGAEGFLDSNSLQCMQNPTVDWPQKDVHLRHGMGLLKLEDEKIVSKPLWGHQGFAYGAVNGVFFDEEGNGFAALNSGVSEQRQGHLALVNRDLIRYFLAGEGA